MLLHHVHVGEWTDPFEGRSESVLRVIDLELHITNVDINVILCICVMNTVFSE